LPNTYLHTIANANEIPIPDFVKIVDNTLYLLELRLQPG
jgi:hypothetical protein